MNASASDALRCSVPALFLDVARREPARIALADGDTTLSYAALEERSARVAAALQERGIGRGAIVGLYLQRSADAIAAMLGVLRSGAAYLPFDASYPPALLRYIHRDSRPATLLVDPALAAEPFWDGAALALPELARTSTACTDVAIDAETPAYVMYTSGSTGRPKGVVVPQRGIVRLVRDTDYADFSPEQTFLQLAPLAFDASTLEIWGPLLNGGRLAIPAADAATLDDIAAQIAHHRVSTLWLTAGVFHLMVEHRLDGLRPLRQLLAGGDVLSPGHVARALAALPDCTLINGYGPTENTTFTCCYRIPRDAGDGPIPIGRPIPHTQIHVLDETRRPVAVGEPGELYAGGLGVALGYLNRPQLTAERFIDNPFGSGTLYRSGDRVRMRADGVCEFLGRADRQVKINGKRVELDEIEACLRRSGQVAEAAVIARDLGGGGRRVEAFITGAQVRPDALRSFLRSELPEVMVPSSITVMDALPLSPTGKVDRRQLEQRAAPASDPAPATAAGDEIETALARIWCKALRRDQVGADDNFFDLGGTSLQLLDVHAAIRATLKADAKLLDLFRHSRIRSQAEWIRGAGAADVSGRQAQDRAARQRLALAALRTRHLDQRPKPGVRSA